MLPLHPKSFDAHLKDKGDNKRPLTPMSAKNEKKWQCSGELNWPLDFHLWITQGRTHRAYHYLSVFY